MIQMTVEQLKSYNEQNISELLKTVQPVLSHRLSLYQRYARKINENEFMHGKDKDGNKKEIIAFEFYIVNMVQGYLGGKAPMYSVSTPSDYAIVKAKKSFFEKAAQSLGMDKAAQKSADKRKQQYVKNYTEALEYIRQYNDDAATYIELLHDYLITTAAYLYIYENKDNEIIYTRFDSRQTVAIFDYSTPVNQIGIVRTWKQRNIEKKEIDVIEVITDEFRTIYTDSAITENELLQWKDVPSVAFENPDGIAVFEPAMSSIDTYEQLNDNVKNMTQYNDQAKLLFTGYTAENDAIIEDTNGNPIENPKRVEEEARYLKAPVLFVPDGDSGHTSTISWLLKDVNYDGILAVMKNLHNMITMLTGVPNMTDEAFSNADNASALGYKLYALDQYSATADRVFRRGLLRLYEIITNRLNLKGEQFDFRDIIIKLQRNIPTDKDKSLARALSAYQGSLISQETAINESQLEVDAQEEMERQQNEQDADYQELKKRAAENSQMNSDDAAPDDGQSVK